MRDKYKNLKRSLLNFFMAKKKVEFMATKSVKISSEGTTELNNLVSSEGNQKNNIVFDIAVNSSWKYVVENYKNSKYPVSPLDIAKYLGSMDSLYLPDQLKYNSVTKIDERLAIIGLVAIRFQKGKFSI